MKDKFIVYFNFKRTFLYFFVLCIFTIVSLYGAASSYLNHNLLNAIIFTVFLLVLGITNLAYLITFIKMNSNDKAKNF